MILSLLNPKIKIKKMTFPIAPSKALSSQRSEEMEPKAGISIAERQGQFASKCQFVRMKNAKTQ
jgi:hypothetical protein